MTETPQLPLPIMGGGQNAAHNLEGKWILISAFKAVKDREDNLTLICILSTGGLENEGKERGGHPADGKSK